MKNNRVAHYMGTNAANKSGKSDKVYIACVRAVMDEHGQTLYVVIGKWGARGTPLQQQEKGAYATLESARREAQKLISSKLRKGYKDIESASYTGPLSVGDPEIQEWLEPEREGVTVTALPMPDFPDGWADPNPEPEPSVGPKPESDPDFEDADDVVVVCKSNLGLEESFEEGVEYLLLADGGGDLITVLDRLGREVEVYRDRFEEAMVPTE